MMKLNVAKATVVLCLVLFGCDDGGRTFGGRMAGRAETVGENIYVMGGMNLSRSISEVGAYNHSTKTWTQLASIPTPRAGPGSAVLDSDIYVIGGRDGRRVLSTCEKYIVKEDRWASCGAMPTGRWVLMTAATGGRLYAFGGISGVGNNRRALDVAEVYDPTSDSWESLGKMPQVRHDAAVASVDGRIYIVSGKVASYVENTAGDVITDRVDVFDTREGSWSRAEDIPTGRSGSQAIVSNGLIFIVGGIGKDGSFPTTVDVFDPRANQWRSGPSLSFGRGGHLAALAADSIIVFGGMRVPYGNRTPSILTSTERVSVSEYKR